MNVADILARCAPQFESAPICIFNDAPVSFADFTDQVARLSSALIERGVGEGCRVVLLSSNRPELLISLFAVWAAGAVAVPVNPMLAAAEIAVIVDHCEPALIVVEGKLASLLGDSRAGYRTCGIGDDGEGEWLAWIRQSQPLAKPANMASTDPALIYYTSGTTGTPKGVVHSQSAVIETAAMLSRHLLITPEDRLLITGPMAFILHLTMNALTALSGGASIVILERFHPELVFTAVAKHRVTVLIGVPTAYVMLSNWLDGRCADLSSVRFAYSAGASFPEALLQRVLSSLGILVSDLWGMSECGPITSYSPTSIGARRADSCGRPLPNCAVRIVDDELRDVPQGEVGEVLARSRGVLSGYFKNPQATKETLVDGWVRSGDLGRLDEDGYLFIVGRKKDMIIRGGANIYPADIEELLYTHEAVSECAVIGMPDATFGETVKAFVVLKPGMRAEPADIIDYCRQRIAEYKVPAEIALIDSLPKGATGKVLRRQLVEMSSEATAAPSNQSEDA